MLVLAFAIAGTVDIDLSTDSLGVIRTHPAYLRDIWPASEEIEELVAKHVGQKFFRRAYKRVFDGDEFWKKLPLGRA